MKIFLFAAAALLVGMSPAAAAVGGDPGGFIAAINGSEPDAIFEGLPHPGFERLLFEREKSRKDVFSIAGSVFYRSPLPLDAAEMSRVAAILTRRDAYARYRGPAMCGGFHADYAVQWRRKEGEFTCLICFGCHEFRLVDKGRVISAEISEEAYPRLKDLLSEKRRHRPRDKPAGKGGGDATR